MPDPGFPVFMPDSGFSAFEGQGGPVALPVDSRVLWRGDGVDGLDEPHAGAVEPEGDGALRVAAGGKLVRRVLLRDGDDERAGERLAQVQEAHGQSLPRRERGGVLPGDELEREAERLIGAGA